MRVGVSVRSAYGVGDVREGASWMVERARAAQEAGLDSLFVGDHHAVPVPYYQNSPILGRMLAEWGDRPAGALFLLPLWHPVLVAEQVGTLASVMHGPFVLQCAIGAGRQQFDAMGTELRGRTSRFETALAVVRALLAGETVTEEDVWGIRDAQVNPRPREPVEVWIGATAAPAIDRAARLGDGWLAAPELVPEEADSAAQEYRERCEAHGRQPTAVAIRRDVHVGDSEVDAERVAGPIIAAGYRGFRPDATVVGSPDQVAERFAELAQMGYTDVIVRHLAEDQAEVLASFERLAEVRAAVADL